VVLYHGDLFKWVAAAGLGLSTRRVSGLNEESAEGEIKRRVGRPHGDRLAVRPVNWRGGGRNKYADEWSQHNQGQAVLFYDLGVVHRPQRRTAGGVLAVCRQPGAASRLRNPIAFLVRHGVGNLALGARLSVPTAAFRGDRLAGVRTPVFLCVCGVGLVPVELTQAHARRHEQGQDEQE
jgi:hypothetical protein